MRKLAPPLIVAGTVVTVCGIAVVVFYVIDVSPLSPVVGVAIATLGASITAYGRRLRPLDRPAPQHGEDRAVDPAVVYLRPFHHEGSSAHPGAWLAGPYMFSVETEEEQMVLAAEEVFGPCVAIARPGQRVPLLGARRLPADDDEWQNVVTGWLSRASIALIRVGETPGIATELGLVAANVSPQRIVLLVPGSFARGGVRARRATRDFVREYSGHELRTLPNIWPDGRSLAAIIYFDAQRQPHVWKLKRPFRSVSLSRPFVAMFRLAFEQVRKAGGIGDRTA